MSNHMTQYAECVGQMVANTEAMSDTEVRAKVGDFAVSSPVFRYDRCPVCQAWTRQDGKLRAGLDCPAVKKALEEKR
jgi:hypothetical protein